ncbi:MAG: hypothetical protein OEV59_00720 [Deltaproteobacteria bacterium]|nr:hypothetical protein [Deltaproteobacteria bacterium]
MKKNSADNGAVCVFSEEKLDEFKSMPVHLRLKWLWDANVFLNNALGLEKRAEEDGRFKVFLEKPGK